jgi:hypothetical protein
MTNPGNLPDEDALTLKKIRAGCPELDAVTGHIRVLPLVAWSRDPIRS